MNNKFTRRATLAQILGTAAVAGCASSAADGKIAVKTAETPNILTTQPEGAFDLFVSKGRPLAMLSSGGSLPVPVLFDTGTNGNAIDFSVFESFGLEKKKNHKSFVTDAAGTTIETYAANLPEGRLSDLPIKSQAIDVYGYRDGVETGILGPDLFRDSAVLMNFPKQSVYVRNAFHDSLTPPQAQSYFPDTGDGLPMIGISVKGFDENMFGTIDSGKNGALSFPPDMMDKLPLVAKPTIVGKATTVFETVDVMGAQIDAEITIGTVTLDRPDVIFHGDTPKVGMPVLSQMRIWLEPALQRSWIASPRALGAQDQDEFTGEFGVRKIWAGPDGLRYQRDGSPERELVYLGADHFLMAKSETDLIFRRNDLGEITGYTLLGDDGQPFEVTR